MAAIVKDNKHAHQKTASKHGQRNRQPPRHGNRPIHQAPKSDVGNERVQKLPHGAPRRRLLVFSDDVFPKMAGSRLIGATVGCALFHQENVRILNSAELLIRADNDIEFPKRKHLFNMFCISVPIEVVNRIQIPSI